MGLPISALAATAALSAAAPQAAPGEPGLRTVSQVLQLDDELLSNPDLRRGGRGFRRWQAWFPDDEVPADLRTRPFEAEARVVLDVDRDGRPTSCRILRPSGEPRLDELVCPRFLEQARLPLHYDRPGVPGPVRTVMSVSWRTAPPAPFAPAPPAPPPPPSRGAAAGPWPRLTWDGMLALADLPDVQAHYPSEARGAEGVVSLDLIVSSAEGVTDCIVGIGSGSAVLDTAACRAAAALPLLYVDRCDECRTARIPIQIVWRRNRSYVRFPLPSSWDEHAADAPPLHPDDRRGARSYRSGTVRAEFSAAELTPLVRAAAGDTRLTVPNLRPSYSLVFDREGVLRACAPLHSIGSAAGDAAACRLLERRSADLSPTDVFGDPLEGRMYVPIDFERSLRRGEALSR